MKKLFLLIGFISIIFLNSNIAEASEKASASSAKIQIKNEYAEDYRVRVLQSFLRKYNSPFTSNAKDFVKYADSYDLDWRLLVAISGVESTFGQQIPYNSYNAWGWGIYGSNMFYFESWDKAIETISKSLRENYINRWGAQDIYEIGRFYAASPTWAYRVNYFMNAIGEFALRNPQDTLSLSL